MTFWTGLKQTYALSARFVLALPLVALAIVAVEGAQHVAEWLIGMYASPHAARATADHPARMAVGYAKVAWLLLIQYWAARFVATEGDARATFARDRRAIAAFAWVLVYDMVLALLTLRLPFLLEAAGMAARPAALTSLAVSLLTSPLGIALSAWTVGAALGDPRASPLFAFARARGHIVWGLALSLVAVLPLMVAHYALGLGAIGRAPAQAIPMLAVDAVLVGFLGVVINLSGVIIARRMAAAVGEDLRIGGPVANIEATPTAPPLLA